MKASALEKTYRRLLEMQKERPDDTPSGVESRMTETWEVQKTENADEKDEY